MIQLSGYKEITLDSDTSEPKTVFVVGPLRRLVILELVSSGEFDPNDDDDMARLGVRALFSMVRAVRNVKKGDRLVTVSGRKVQDVIDSLPTEMLNELLEKLTEMSGLGVETEKN